MKTAARTALEAWRGALVETVRREGRDLSARQMAVLLDVYLMPAPHTVRGLARELGLSKPVITRAVDTLGRLGLVRRERDPADRRSVLIRRTIKGSAYVREFAELVVKAAEAVAPARAGGAG